MERLIDKIRGITGEYSFMKVNRFAIKMMGGNVSAALILNQIYYWGEVVGGKFYKTIDSFVEETTIPRTTVISSINKLTSMGIVNKSREAANGASVSHYTINNDTLSSLLANSIYNDSYYNRLSLVNSYKAVLNCRLNNDDTDISSIPINRYVIKLLGDTTTALIMQQLIYWYDKSGGMFYKSYEELAEETSQSRKTVMNAVKKLVSRGYITKRLKRANGHAVNHYTIVEKVFLEDLKNITRGDKYRAKVKVKIAAREMAEMMKADTILRNINLDTTEKYEKGTDESTKRALLLTENKEKNKDTILVLSNDNTRRTMTITLPPSLKGEIEIEVKSKYNNNIILKRTIDMERYTRKHINKDDIPYFKVEKHISEIIIKREMHLKENQRIAPAQRAELIRLYNQHGEKKFTEYCRWAGLMGFSLAHAVASADKALAKWGNATRNNPAEVDAEQDSQARIERTNKILEEYERLYEEHKARIAQKKGLNNENQSE